MADTFDITFDKEQAVYREGDSIHGIVTIVNSEDIHYKVIWIEVCGISVVHWSADENKTQLNSMITSLNTSKQQYFHTKITLLEKDGSFIEKNPVLTAGNHTYEFACKLPPELPSSFEGTYGQVRYLARATIERPFKTNLVTIKGFTVLSGLDLNFIPEAAARLELCKYKQVGQCCVPSGTVTVEWLVERSGFVPGESIIVHGHLQNDCKAPVVYCKTALNMIIDYKATKRRQREKREICVMKQEETDPGEIRAWHDPLHIPPLPPTGLGRCALIDINYQLHFSALIEGASSPISYTKDIYIGTVPMCAREMRSCIAGMFNQPYAASMDNLGELGRVSASQVSLAQVVATACAIETAANPSAPAIDHCSSHLLQSGSSSCDDLMSARPPPFAPDHMHHLSPTAPSAYTLGRAETGDKQTYECARFGPVNINDDCNDDHLMMTDCQFTPVYPYYHVNTSTDTEQ